MDGHELIAAVTRDAYQAVSVGPEAAGPSVRATYNPTRGGRYNSNRGHMVVRGGPHHHALGLQQNYYPAPYGQTPAPFFPPDPATSGMVYYGIRQPDQYHDPSNFIGPPIQHPNGFPPNLNHPHTPRGRAPRRPRGPGPGGPPRGHHHRPHHPGPPDHHHHGPPDHHHGPPPDHHRGPRSGPPGHHHDHRHGPPDNPGPTEHFRPPQQHHAPTERTNAFPDYDPPSYETAMSQSAPPSADNRRYDNGGDTGQRSSSYNRGGGSGNRSNQYHHNQQQQQQYPSNNQRRWTQPVGRGGSSSGGARRDAPTRSSLARQPEEEEDYESSVYDKKKYQERERGGSGGGPVTSGREQQQGQRSSSWRSDPPTPKKKLDPLKKKDAIVGEDDRTQRERLTDEMVRGKCECVVCCDFMLPSHEVWSCPNCYNIFHLKCIKKWATAPSEIEDRSWRCPCCQNVTTNFPQRYMCFCGKRANPAINHYDTPHSCGEQCGRRRKAENCHHYCNIQCHPGPCPPCGVYVDQKCPCGAKSEKVRCGQSRPISCGEPCKYNYDCGTHKCKGKCHMGYCGPCDIMVVKKCFCGRQELEESCSGLPEDSLFFACGTACGRTLNCGLHTCQRLCHADDCGPCVLAPELVTRCPCGQTELADMGPDGQRALCTDSVPVCGLICNKELACGDEGEPPHRCQATCHSGQCPPCPLTALLRCRCGSATVEKLCASLTSSDTTSTTTGEGEKGDATTALVECAKRCTKKRSCGRHKCNKRCCTDTAHQCEQTCGRKLTCGLHTCEEPCHLGNCHNCWNTSFDELTCYCGATVLYPPIPCGTRPPICSKPCSRQHGCEHAVQHKCHSDSQCPPCTNLTSKWCYGNHELRTCIPCFRTDVSCGMPCKKPLPCGRHTCILTCHSGSCSVGSGGGAGAEDAVALACSQPCTRPRPKCEHPCAAACHDGECPVTHCKATVAVTCKCGHRTGTKSCVENQQIYQRLVSAAIAVKTHNLEGGQTVDITDAIKDVGLKKNCTLDCSSDCALIDRNRRLALALQIRNPELTNKLKPPAYSDFLKDQVRQVPAFVASIHDKLTELVQSAKQSKQKSRSHAFPPMKSVNRRVIHELSEFFGCDTQSYDEEPKKNVVATAFRDKSFLPSTSVMTVVQKEMGILRTAGKAPPPPSRRTQGSFGNFTSLSGIGASAPANNSPATSLSGTTVVAPVANHWASAATNSSATSSNASFFNVAGNNTASGATNSAPIDYFDYNG